ncbi:hypothetical protein T440DRAFT_219702 [Plenodomus tracheiphilus IPT5]|uniref:Uncharacterized protein n=1 Tax=Plenodomus tracheiphilus IPT5 TaxID=1408161 RepID=A0A6A7AU43_9PLEO|nr:hypothetical protein T440DRAFT_219702 [Plenodomus tracheiphilus IPT5]
MSMLLDIAQCDLLSSCVWMDVMTSSKACLHFTCSLLFLSLRSWTHRWLRTGYISKRSELPVQVKDEVSYLDREAYPDTLEIGDMGPEGSKTYVEVDMKDISELRGSDINSRMLRKDLEGGKRAKIIVGVRVLNGSLVGQHLQCSLEEALAVDNEPAPPPAQPAKSKDKGKPPKGRAPASAPKPTATA